MLNVAEHARNNRRNPTEPEVRLWRHRSNRQLAGLKFRRQHRIDGRIHDPDTDRHRDAYLYQQQGITVIRVSNIDVMINMEGVLSAILDAASRQPERRSDSGVPHPNPVSGKQRPALFRPCRGHGRPETPEGKGL